jgi:pyruvate,water dikinase
VDVTGLVRNPIGARIVPRILEAVEPGSSGAMKQILNDERTGAGAGRLGIRALLRVSAFLIPWLWRVVWTAIWPGGVAEQIRSRYHHQIRALERRARAQRASKRRLRHALGLLRDLLDAFPYAVPEIASGAFAGLAPLFLLLSISRWLTGSSDLALKITRGLGHNVTTEMDLQLWEAARSIQADPDSRQRFQAWGAGDLAEAYLRRNLPVTAISAVDAFLDRYGMRGPGEIDIGRPRWREDPLPVFQTLKSYLEIEEGATAPDEIFRRGQREAVVAISELQAAARGRFGGRAVAHVIQWAARRVRSLAGLREAPKFYIVQLMGIMRAQLMKAGAEMARSGMIGEAGDIFFLRLGELEAIAGGEAGDWAGLIASRKEGHRRERRRERIPRLLLSDGRAVYEGLTTSGAQAEELRGSPVSPGVIQGQVRLVLSPGAAGLRPGEIMVCRGTDPAWTPLFLSAGGLIMEVGGMMTHGAIVAREYGIPAVVGVDRATERLRDGDRVEMDGSSGRIVRLS